jgi:hypothetical protein
MEPKLGKVFLAKANKAQILHNERVDIELGKGGECVHQLCKLNLFDQDVEGHEDLQAMAPGRRQNAGQGVDVEVLGSGASIEPVQA